MPKSTRHARSTATASSVGTPGSIVDATLVTFARELGGLLGETQTRAEHWLTHRKGIIARLTDLRDTASRLLTQLAPTGQAVKGKRPARAQAAKAKQTKSPSSSPRGQAATRRTSKGGMSVAATRRPVTPRRRTSPRKKPTSA